MRVTASTLNVRSGPGSEFRVVGQLERGAIVRGIENHGDWIWVDPPGGWANGRYLERNRVIPPIGVKGIVEMFGQPGTAQCSTGRAVLPCPLKLSWADHQITSFACHVEMEAIFTAVFYEISLRGMWPKLREFGGCFNDRPIKDGSKRSTHAWGIAVDLDPKTNETGKGDIHPGIVKTFKAHGFEWGGDFTRSDPMHFQFATNY